MDKFRRCNYVTRMLIIAGVFQLLIVSTTLRVLAQPAGSLYINCGSTVSYTDPATNITWAPDVNYTATGTFATVPNGNSVFSTLTYFNNSRSKNCYNLHPVDHVSPYLLRASFMYGSYDNAPTPLSFEMSIDQTVVENITITNASATYDFEYYFYTGPNGNSTFLCLLQDPTHSVPFISAIAMRPAGSDSILSGGNYYNYRIKHRVNFGGITLVRFPQDTADRYWLPAGPNSNFLQSTTPLQILTTVKKDLNFSQFTPGGYPGLSSALMQPPLMVMQSAITTTTNMTIQLGDVDGYSYFHLNLYFAELDPNANATSRRFGIQVSGSGSGYYSQSPLSDWIENPFNSTYHTSPYYVDFQYWDYPKSDSVTPMTIVLYPLPGTTGPLLNGMEFFEYIQMWYAPIIDQEAKAVEAIKQSLNLTDYIGDPCSPRPYDWVTCSLNDPPTILKINLSGYHLSGNIPPNISALTNLTDLSLANNALTGVIPYLGTLKDLRTLHLENNKLTGIIPNYFATLLQLFELIVYNNNFSGLIPKNIIDDNTLTFNYTPGNPLLNITNIVTNINASPSTRSKPNVPIIIGSIVGGLLACMVIIILFIHCTLGQQMAKHGETKLIVGAARAYTFAEVVLATENFKTEIGKGGFGPVFYGKLEDGQEIAVKVLDEGSCQGTLEFHNEVDLLSRVHHINLVSLVGFSQDKSKQMLVYEYMHNGSLRDHLHVKRESIPSVEILDWKTRLGIALSAAQGLEYLHIGCHPSMIHRDVKSSNILISKKKSFAKVSDFGLSKLSPEDVTHVSTVVKGTVGYLDPEYFTTRCLSPKSDVFSFGVVLLELVTGRLPINIHLSNRDDWNICDWVRSSLEGGKIDNILDPAVRESKPNTDALWKVVDIAVRSVEPKSLHRPTMTEVVQHLRQAIEMEGCPLSDSVNTSDNVSLPLRSSFTTTSKSMSGADFEISGPNPR